MKTVEEKYGCVKHRSKPGINKLMKIALDCAHIYRPIDSMPTLGPTCRGLGPNKAYELGITPSICIIFYRLLNKLLYQTTGKDKCDPVEIIKCYVGPTREKDKRRPIQ